MDGRNWRMLAAGVAGALAIFAVLFYLIGGGEILEVLTSAQPSLVGATVGVGLAWLLAWSLMLRTILGTLGIAVTAFRSFAIYSAAAFANNVTPFGQAGGEPVAALLISRSSTARYETGLVGIASLDVLNVVSSLALIGFGVSYYAVHFTLGERLGTAIGLVAALAGAIAFVFWYVWRHHERFIDRTAGAVARFTQRLPFDRFEGIDEADIVDRMERFFGHVERVAVNRRRLALTLGLSTLGWLLQTAALVAAFAAVGYSAPVYVALFVIPLGNMA
ncbi:lysylphosphatidylglycerol synthase transmembrane domain-containing protein, partial [Natronoarchaeum mannanilyticum]